MKGYLGIDFGTSGSRAFVINDLGQILGEFYDPFVPTSDHQTTSSLWKTTLFKLIEKIPLKLRSQIQAIAINGTSSTVLFCDQMGNPLDEPLLYNDSRGQEFLEILAEIAPPHHTVLSPTSTLAKLLWWVEKKADLSLINSPIYLVHQADWLSFLCHGKLGISDENNVLKLGYDIQNLVYPDWLIQNLPNLIKNVPIQLPQVLSPGTPIRQILPQIAQKLSLPQDCIMVTGTTDSIAAFLASGVHLPGESVTSLGSTLVLKLLSKTYIEDSNYGIYSHRFPNIFQVENSPNFCEKDAENLWLVGGASNTGGAVLRQFFTDQELAELSQKIHPELKTGLDYYPLTKKGERFPINNPNLPPKLEPYPEKREVFLQGILEGISRIEQQGYQLLEKLGATPLTKVYTAGGGAKNTVWTQMRQALLQVSVVASPHTEAAYGSALLALYGIQKKN